MGDNVNRNQLKLTKENSTYKDRNILKVISRTISEDSREDGYTVVFDDGERGFVPLSHFLQRQEGK